MNERSKKTAKFTIATLSISFVSNNITHGISSREQKHFDFFRIIAHYFFIFYVQNMKSVAENIK